MKFSSRLFGSGLFLLALSYYIFFVRLRLLFADSSFSDAGIPSDEVPKRVSTVVATQSTDDPSWLSAFFPSWNHEIYVTDGNNATPSLPANRGREAMVYLTYIIDNYHSLPDVAIFIHANRYQWHNDDPLYDNARVLSRLQLSYVQKQGYVNLKCNWVPGCPAEIRPHEAGALSDQYGPRTAPFYLSVFPELFPDLKVPDTVGLSCCAQFAVGKKQILARPRSDYERYRNWLLETDLDDSLSGRILEYSWQIVFGQKSVYCPNAKDCYCKVYGLCDLTCDEPGVCHGHWIYPKYSTLPEGWPWYDWDGEWQNATAM